MTAIQIVADYLKANGYDGLANTECGCVLSDLQPCSEDFADCQPAYKHKSTDPDYDWDMKTEKPEGERTSPLDKAMPMLMQMEIP